MSSALMGVIAASRGVSKPPAFDPTVLVPGCELWLDGDDPGTMYDATSGGSLVAPDGLIARWEDKSGFGNHATQATSSSRFQRKASYLNGKGGVYTSGSPRHMRTPVSLASLSTYTIFLVLRVPSMTNSRSAMRWQESSSQYVILPFNTDGRHVSSADGTTTGVQTGLTAGSVTLLTAQRGSSLRAWKNGLLSGSRVAGAGALGTTLTVLTLGRYNVGASEYFTGDYAEVIVYRTGLSDTNRALIDAGLKNKWGIL